ncbi:peptide chain release factor N(5)-glutamine methyltransferase [Colwelliaceae bacterium 6471]
MSNETSAMVDRHLPDEPKAFNAEKQENSASFMISSLVGRHIQALIDFGLQRLKVCSDTAKLDAQILLSTVLNKPTSYLLTWPEQVLTDEQCLHYLTLLNRRYNGEPIAYIIGSREFWSLTLLVSPATLIPRPDTEILVEQVLSLYADQQQKSIRCLDLGTGTGAIALALASELPKWTIDAVDFSREAVTLAQKNATRLNLETVNIFYSNWFEGVQVDTKYDVIVSNPPYIDELDEHLSQGDVRYEPKSALVADDNGLGDIKHIADKAREYLQDGGCLIFEHGFTQAKEVQQILKVLGYHGMQTAIDFSGHDRITWANWTTKPLP